MPDPLSDLLRLSDQQKHDCDLTDTPREIQQQPATWRDTHRLLKAAHASILTFLNQCGMSPRSTRLPHVILTAGTSDYIGRALSQLLQHQWGCTVRAIPAPPSSPP
jgi:fructoselysine-6-P-deglycase FrlB-like protein